MTNLNDEWCVLGQLSERSFIAGLALAGILASSRHGSAEHLATKSLEVTDALLKKLKERTKYD